MVYFAKSHSFTTFAVPNSKNIKPQNKMQKTTLLFEKSKQRSSLPLGGVGGGFHYSFFFSQQPSSHVMEIPKEMGKMIAFG